MVSNEPHTFSLALLESKQGSCLFIICQCGPLQKIVRLALSRQLLSSWVTVALLWPSLLHLSPCQDSSFIYRKAFTQINTATQQLPRTHTHTHANTRTHTGTHTLPDFGLWSEQNKTRLLWARLFVWFLSFFLLIVPTQHALLTLLLLDCSPSSLNPLLAVPLISPWESSEPELDEVVCGGGTPHPPTHTHTFAIATHPPPLLTANQCVWVSPCGCGPGSLKGEPRRASLPFLHQGMEKTSYLKPAQIGYPPEDPPICLQHPLTGEASEDMVYTHTLPFISTFLTSSFLKMDYSTTAS